ncbi:hypothetical protein GGS20DRAFT_591453 [Poronia punctata]|nr:hypothetical protein GGS20DRAFT_591453 [Poronia punctata]
MSSKRKFSEVSTAEPFGQGEKAPGHSKFRHNKKKKTTAISKANSTSLNGMKKRARTIERRLACQQSLPANVRHELEKELEHHKANIEETADHKRRRDMIAKYHMVRFFERKKADRLAKQIRSQLETETDEEERKKLEADLHIAQIDSLYAKFFPYRERYISLYPAASKKDTQEQQSKKEDASSAAKAALHTERPPMWKVIEETAKKGDLALKLLVERKSSSSTRENSQTQELRPPKQSLAAKPGRSKAKNSFPPEKTTDSHTSKNERQQTHGSGSDDDSDGGFFEEG